MPHIHVLDQITIDKIAAGEVIERPASIVKELVENAIDAGSTSVTVEIKDGGISFIRIRDNGCGIPKEEVKSAFLRHSTSKIETVEEYVDDVLSREVNYPTVIGESVMIPHPLMTFAKETAVAAAILKPPVTICKKAVKVIFLLAIEGRPNDDVSILFEFFKQVAMNENLVNTLYEAKDETDFLNRLISISTSIELF